MDNCCCSSGDCCSSPQARKTITIDFLYLDLSICGRCMNTESALDEAVTNVMAVLTAAGFDVKVNKVNITTRELAEQYRFISSPTIRVNGHDIATELKETLCEDCGDLCGDDVDCRIWVYNGEEYTAPPKEFLVNAILKEVYGESRECSEQEKYELPQNLENFFVAKERQDNIQSETGDL